MHADGNGKIISKINEYNKKRVLVIADGAAYGVYYNQTLQIIRARGESVKAVLWVPESFEYVILKSGVIKHDKTVETILEDTAEFIESSIYCSWERFYTQLLIDLTIFYDNCI